MAFTNSVKFRIAFAYTVSVGISLIMCGAILLCSFHAWEFSGVDKMLRFFHDEFEYEYLTGKEELINATRIVPNELPSACRTTAGEEPLMAFRLAGDGGGFVCVFKKNGRVFERLLDAAGSMHTSLPLPTDTKTFMANIFTRESHGDGATDLYAVLLSSDYSVLASMPCDEQVLNALKNNAQYARGKAQNVRKHFADEHRHMYLRIRAHKLHDGNILVVGVDNTTYYQYLIALIIVLGSVLFLMIIFCIIFGILLARKFTRSIVAIAEVARDFQRGDYSKRVPVPRAGEEIRLLANAFNDMGESTQKMMTELRMISDNIAHDLRTPLTRLRGEAELSLYSKDVSTLAEDVAEECNSMLDMINTMLDITQTTYNIGAVPRERIDLSALAEKIITLFSSIAEDQKVKLSATFPSDPVFFFGHKAKLQQIIGNLLDNAIKFTPENGSVTLQLTNDDKHVQIIVADTGCGITATDLPHVCERFYRADVSRSRAGNGLGLSLVKAVVTSYGGRLLINSEPGHGTTVTVVLPHAGDVSSASAD